MKKILLLVILTFLVFNSCNKEDNPLVPDQVIVVPNDGTKVLSEELTNQLVTSNISQDSLFFNGDVNDLKADDIIISDAGDGILRKVQSIEKVGSQSLVITDTTSLADAFQQLAFDDSFDITEEDIAEIVYDVPGIKLMKTNNPTGLSFDIENLVFYDDDGNNSTTDDQVKGSGSFTLELKPSFKCTIDHGLKYFKAAIKPTGTIEIKATSDISLQFLNKSIKVATLKMKKKVLWVGWVPIVILTDIPIYLGVEGEISAGIKASIKDKAYFEFGGEYKNSSFHFIANAGNEFTFEPPEIYGAASLKFYIQPNINYKVYGAAGPQLKFNIFLSGEGEITGSTVSAELFAGLDAEVGMILKMFGKNLSFKSEPLFVIKKSLWKWSSPLGGNTPPSVTTDQILEYSSDEAYAGGNVTDVGSAPVTARGVCWSTSQNPTISDNKTNNGQGPGIFSSIIQGLSPSTTYYVRAYATNSAGTAYGNQVYFTTQTASTPPTVTTNQISGFTSTEAYCGGNVTDDGSSYVTAKGVCWSTSQNPTISDNKTDDGTGTGSFTSVIQGLSPSTTYYVRAYATNSAGTSYGNQVYFTTQQTSGFVWYQQTSGTTNNLSEVYFTDENNGWVVGANGIILHTTNGGTIWTEQTSGVTMPLFGVCFVDANTGWAISKNIIIKTTNGGITWTEQFVPGTPDNLHKVYFTNANTGWVVGNFGSILKTTNGGENWTQQESGTGQHLIGLSVIDVNIATAVGYGNTILRTTNGGTTWTSQSSATTGVNFDGVYFTNANNGTVVGYNGVILRTTNGGTTWPSVQYYTSNNLYDVYFTNANNGWIVGVVGTILKSTNGGTSWAQQTGVTAETLSGLFFLDDNNGWIVGSNGTILHTQP